MLNAILEKRYAHLSIEQKKAKIRRNLWAAFWILNIGVWYNVGLEYMRFFVHNMGA